MHLTDLAIERMKPAKGQQDYTDDSIPGFVLRVGKRAKTFMLVIGSGSDRRRITLGRYSPPHFTLSAARKKAHELIGTHQAGRSAIGLLDARNAFLDTYRIKNKPSTAEETERLLKRHLPQKGALLDLTRKKMVAVLDDIASRSERRHFYTAAHTFFRWCRRYDFPNPLEGVEKPPKGKPRARLISPEEFVKIWQGSMKLGTYGRICRVLMLSGQRLNQIAELRGEWINSRDYVIAWSAEFMKGREFLLPYGSLLHQQLPQHDGLLFPNEQGTVWTTWGDPHQLLLSYARVPHFTRHDFRRFYSTTHSAIGTPPHIRELLLDHAIGSEVSRIYDRHSYLSEKRAAQLAYEQHISKLLDGASV